MNKIIIFAFVLFSAALSPLHAQETPAKQGASAEGMNLDRVNDEVRYENAYQLYKIKRTGQALMLFGEYLELYAEGAHRKDVLRHMGDIYLSRNDYPRAIKYFSLLYEEFANDDEGVGGYYQTGICFSRMGKQEKAIEIFKDIIFIGLFK